MRAPTARWALPIVFAIAGCGSTAAGPPQGAPPAARSQALAASPDAPPSHARAGQPPPAAGAVAPAHPIPASFRVSPGAPSDAQVRAELRQMQHVQRQLQLSATAANAAALLPWTQEPKSGEKISVASVFRDYNLGLACGGVLGRLQQGVAHKTAPCGTRITFTYGGRSLTVPVIDRGPYIVGREWDLTGATADALGFPGLGAIKWAVAS